MNNAKPRERKMSTADQENVNEEYFEPLMSLIESNLRICAANPGGFERGLIEEAADAICVLNGTATRRTCRRVLAALDALEPAA